jgi:DNA mismatch repair protein MutL
VNERFVKNPYLTHAVVSSYEEMIAPGSFPFFALFIELDPARVDVNVHPTKQEIKFEDEKLVYTFIKSAIRHALAQFSISPALDFNLDPSIQHTDALNKPITNEADQRVQSGGLYKSFIDRSQAHRIESSSNLKDWKSFFTSSNNSENSYQETFFQDQHLHQIKRSSSLELPPSAPVFQMNQTYIVFEQSNGITILHQQLAHQQVLFEKFNAAWQGKAIPVQQNLFPQAIQFSPADAQIIQHILPDLLQLGYQLEPFGNNAFLLQGIPADYATDNDQSVIEMILEDIKENTSSLHRGYKEKMAKTLARKHAVKPGTVLDDSTMRDLVFRLSLSLSGATHFDGKPLLVEVKKEYLSSVFGL